jgi:hypothetical protein
LLVCASCSTKSNGKAVCEGLDSLGWVDIEIVSLAKVWKIAKRKSLFFFNQSTFIAEVMHDF